MLFGTADTTGVTSAIDPLWMLAAGLAVVIGMILVLRMNAFLALICGALTVSLMAPGDWSGKIGRMTEAFGSMAGKIGILIAMAAIIGRCMMDSGAADRIIRAFCRLLGKKHVPAALVGSGFVLSVPVFFDTVFYLLVPLARSFYAQIKKNYMLCLMATVAGAMITHTLVPPTPGPLLVAETLGVPVGMMMLVGGMVGFCLFPIGIAACHLINWYMPQPEGDFEVKPTLDEDGNEEAEPSLPSLSLSLLPIVLPVLLISAKTISDMWLAAQADATLVTSRLHEVLSVVGNKDLALMVAAAIAMFVLVRQRKLTLKKLNKVVESALMDGALIILITAAGGAFGQMLREAGVGLRIKEICGGETALTGTFLLLLAWGVASALKIAQGSSTTAMITASGIIASMNITASTLGCHPAYLAAAIGTGSLVFSWMNDSGFWLFCRMGHIKETETLKSWTVIHIIMGVSGLGVVLLLSQLVPLV